MGKFINRERLCEEIDRETNPKRKRRLEEFLAWVDEEKTGKEWLPPDYDASAHFKKYGLI